MNLKEKINPLVSLLVLIAFLLTFSGMALRIVNLTEFYDAKIEYYEDALMPKVMNVFFAVSALFFLVSTFIVSRKKALDGAAVTSLPFKIVSAVCSLSMLLSLIRGVMDENYSNTLLLTSLFFFFSAIHFALYLLNKRPSATAVFALFPIAVSVMILGITYFDVLTTMNAPNKVLIHFACIASMLGFLVDARLISDNKRKLPYFFCITLALFFTGVSSVPSVILYFSNSFDYSYINHDTALLGFFIYFAARAVTLCFNGKEELKADDGADVEATPEIE